MTIEKVELFKLNNSGEINAGSSDETTKNKPADESIHTATTKTELKSEENNPTGKSIHTISTDEETLQDRKESKLPSKSNIELFSSKPAESEIDTWIRPEQINTELIKKYKSKLEEYEKKHGKIDFSKIKRHWEKFSRKYNITHREYSDSEILESKIEAHKLWCENQGEKLLAEEDNNLFAFINCNAKNRSIKTGAACAITMDKCSTDTDKLIQDLCDKKPPSIEAKRETKELCEYNGKKLAFSSHLVARYCQDKKEKEECYKTAAAASEQLQEKTLDIIDKSNLKEIYDLNDYESILDATDACVETAIDNIKYYAKKANLPPEFIQKLENTKIQILEKINERKQEIIQKHIEYLDKKIAIKEKILEHRKEILEKRTKEKQIAKVKVAKAIETSKYWINFAKKAIAWMGLNDLNHEKKREVVKRKDPKLAIEIAYAKRYEKWAKEDAATANFKARMAERSVDLMEISLSYSKVQQEILTMQA